MRTMLKPFCVAILISGSWGNLSVAGEGAYSGQAVKESGAASTHGSASVANGIIASGQVTSAAAAVPLSVGGAVLISGGAASVSAAQGSMRAASVTPRKGPLKVTDETITVTPPDKALKQATKPVGER